MLLFVDRPEGFVFGPYELLRNGPELKCRAAKVPASPKVLSTLLTLVDRAGEIVTKAELMEIVWPDCFVDEANLTQNIFVLRKLLAAEFGQRQVIETITRQGYRFAEPVLPLALEPRPKEDSADHDPGRIIEGAAGQARRLELSHWVLLALGCCCALALLWKLHSHRSRSQGQAFTLQRLTSHSSQNQITAVALSRDGHMLAFTDADGIEVRPFDSETLQTFSIPAIRDVQSLAWFPDGLHLLLCGSAADQGKAQIWQVSLTGEQPRLLVDDAESGALSASGTQVAFVRQHGTELWLASATGEQARHLQTSKDGFNFTSLLWTADDRHLLVESHRPLASSGYLLPGANELATQVEGSLLVIDPLSGTTTSSRSNVFLASATRVGPHGVLFTRSALGHSTEASTVWRVELDPDSGDFSTPPETVASLAPDQPHIYAFTADRSGKIIVTLSQKGPVGVYVGSWDSAHARLENIRQLTQNGDVAYPHAWSADSSAVLYESFKENHWQIYQQKLDQHNGRPLVISDMDQVSPRLTSDGRWVLFLGRSRKGDHLHLYRVLASGGSPTLVSDRPDILQIRCPLQKGLCMAQLSGQGGHRTYNQLDPMHGIGPIIFSDSAGWGDADWDVSADGSSLALLSSSASQAGIHVVELARKSVVALADRKDKALVAVNWDNPGFDLLIADANASGRFNIVKVDLTGHSQPVVSSGRSTWAVPSPDGKHVAFLDQSTDSNLWQMKVH